MRPLVSARGEHDLLSPDVAGGRAKQESAIVASTQPGNRNTFPNGCPKAPGVARQIGDDVVSRHEAVRIIARVAAARELHRPVRKHETETVPASPPGLADPTALQYDVVDRCTTKLVAQRESGLASTNHHEVNGLGHRSSS